MSLWLARLPKFGQNRKTAFKYAASSQTETNCCLPTPVLICLNR